jgi:hypothetical protein
MNVENGIPDRLVRSLTAKAAYSRAARKKLVEFKAKLYGVRDAIKHEIATGCLQSSDKMECEQRALDIRLATAESRLKALQKSREDEWEPLRDDLDSAWEDLSRSINKLVARIKDETG